MTYIYRSCQQSLTDVPHQPVPRLSQTTLQFLSSHKLLTSYDTDPVILLSLLQHQNWEAIKRQMARSAN